MSADGRAALRTHLAAEERVTDVLSHFIWLACRLPSLMTHASVSAEDRAKLGIDDELVRLSCGIEDVRDLEGDLQAAARKVLKL